MTLDDETAERITREAFEKYGPTDSLADYVRAGWDARDAEVEELRAEVQRAKDQANNLAGDLAQAETERDAALATLAKVQERVERRHCADDPLCGHDDQVWADHFSEVVADVLAILDESPTEREREHFHIWSELPCKPGECRMEGSPERETPAKPEGWARCNVNAFHSKSAAYAAGYMNGWDARGGGSR